MDLVLTETCASIFASVATALGVPIAVVVFWRDRRLAREAREIETQLALQAEYSTFLDLCLERPDLQLYDYHPGVPDQLSEDPSPQQMIALERLVSMFETAYFLYHGRAHRKRFRKRQWTGWEVYIRKWCARPGFRSAWQSYLGREFDSDFVGKVDSLLAKVAPNESATAPS